MDDTASRLAAAQRFGAGLFCLGFVVAGISLFFAPARVYPSYLVGFVFWIGLTLGCFPILMIYYLVGGIWGTPVRRFLEAGIATLPLMAALLVPLLFGFGYLYKWAQPQVLRADLLLQHKQLYLNLPALVMRMILFFCIWGALGFLLLRWSRRQARTTEPRPLIMLRRISAPGLVLFGLATSFASIDWVMALEPDWYSSIFPLIILMGQILSALALSIILSEALASESDGPTPDQLNQLGDLLLTFVMLWAYMSISQIIIIYAGNLPHEIIWYLHRMRGGWLPVSWLLAIFAFSIPFLLLLFRRLKRAPASLCGIAGGLLIIQAVCVFWYVAPSFRSSLSLDWIDPFTFFGIGGGWIAVFSYRLSHSGRSAGPQEHFA
jgi:hypothetical protein